MSRFSMISLALATSLYTGVAVDAATPDGRGFPSPDAAATALVGAAKSGDMDALLAVLGPSAKEILVTSDPVADKKVRATFLARAAQGVKTTAEPGKPDTRILVAGKDRWPLPIPIVKVDGKWYFDVEQGKDEILTRRIGSNELDAIEVCRGYVEAQDDYIQLKRIDGGVQQYAQKIISTNGKHDGLYWPVTSGQEESPIGDVVAKAFAQGYTQKGDPYHGYFFKVLTAQGPHAPGGAKSYIANGAMTKGFALIAWPSDYGSTGVMTFLVDKTGIVYQKDLGPTTSAITGTYTAYDPDSTWSPVSFSLGQGTGGR